MTHHTVFPCLVTVLALSAGCTELQEAPHLLHPSPSENTPGLTTASTPSNPEPEPEPEQVAVLDAIPLGDTDPEGLALGPDGALYIAMGDSDGVYRYDTLNDTLEPFTPLGRMDDIQGLTFGPDGHLYVASRGEDVIAAFDGVSGASLGVHAIASGPNSLVFNEQAEMLVTLRDYASVAEFDASGNAAGTFATSGDLGYPEGLAFGPDGDLYVAGRASSVVTRFDGTTGEPVAIIGAGVLAAPEGVVFDAFGDLWVSSRDSGQVVRLNLAEGDVRQKIDLSLGSRPIGIALGPEGDTWVVTRDTGLLVRIGVPPS